MGWLIAIGAIVFLAAAFSAAFSLCMAAGDEDDDAEQMKDTRIWKKSAENGRMTGTYINAQFLPLDLCIRSILHICVDIR